MTDRHVAYTVTLLEPVRSDDAQRIIDAIAMIKGVAEVVPVVADPGTYFARSAAYREFYVALQEFIAGLKP